MKTNKILKVMATTIIIMILVFISFIGIYVYKTGKMENVVKDYKLGMELGGGRQIILEPSDELKTVYQSQDGKQLNDISKLSEEEKADYTETQVSVNSSEVLTTDNFKTTEQIFQNRLGKAGLMEYQIAVNEETGNIVLNAAEELILDDIIYSIFEPGKFEITDTETEEVLINNSHIKDSRVGYNTTQAGTAIYLTIELNGDGSKKLEEISQIYTKTTDQDGTETTKTVTLSIDGQTITTTYFGEKMTNGLLQLSIGSATKDTESLSKYVKEASNLAILLSTGASPVEYNISVNQFLSTGLSKNTATILLLTAVALVSAMIVYIVIEYKERGIIAGITFVGYIATLLLAIRLSNVVITIESIGAIILSIIFNYVFLNILLAKLSKYRKNDSTPKAEMNKLLIKTLFTLVPALVIAVVFSLITTMAITSLGTSLFWGIAVFLVYTYLITKPLLLNFEYLFEE